MRVGSKLLCLGCLNHNVWVKRCLAFPLIWPSSPHSASVRRALSASTAICVYNPLEYDVNKTEIHCLQRELQCPPIRNESWLWSQGLLLTLHRRPPTNVESSKTSHDTGRPVPFGTICHGSGSLPAHFKSLIDGLSGRLLLYHLSGQARKKTLTFYSLNASQDTVDQASTTSEL